MFYKKIFFLLFLFVCFAQSANAANQVVTNNNDSGSGSLRQAILDIESSGSDGDTITFNLSAGNETITISSQFSLIWQKNFNIDGDNTAGSGTNVTVQVTTPGVSSYRIFEIRPYSGTYTFSNMTLKGGTVGSGQGGVIKVYSGDSTGNLTLNNMTVRDGVSNYGGCVYAWGTIGTLTISNSTFTSCTTDSTSYGGGAIFIRSHQNAPSISGSTFSNNTSAGSGGAIHIFDETFSITNTTFSNNSSTSSGGAIYVDGDDTLAASTITGSTFASNTGNGSAGNDFGGAVYYYYGKHQITNSTFFDNESQIGGAVAYSYSPEIHLTNNTIVANTSTSALGGGVYHGTSSVLRIKNTLLANNTANSSANDFYNDGSTITDNGYNLVEYSTGKTWNGTGDITGNQSSLNISASLADNDTSNGTQTLALSTGSVAADAGASGTNNSVSVPTTDQRGFSRSGTTDIGSYELQSDVTAPTITNVSSDKADGSYKAGEVIDIDVTFSEAVTSTGNVTVTLETGDTDRTCTFTVSNSTTGSCNYTVQSGDASSDLNVATISGTIADQSSNAMSNFVPTTNLSANKALVIDTTAPVLSEATAVTTPTTDTTPDYVFSTTEAGTISYGGSCSSATTSASSGSNTITLATLTAGTYSDCTIIVTDTATNASNSLSVTSFTVDPDAPIISSVQSSPSQTSVTITWTTDENASSQVYYGATDSYGSNTSEADTAPRVTSHSVSLSSLSCGSTYHFKVVSKDALENSSVPNDNTFTANACTVVAPAGSVPVWLLPSITQQINTQNNSQQIFHADPVTNTNSSSPVTANSSSNYVFSKNLRRGSNHLDVTELQKFLKEQGEDIYPEGIVSGYFGNLTKKAIIRFQEKYAEDILHPVGLKKGSGVLGEYTRKKINQITALGRQPARNSLSIGGAGGDLPNNPLAY